MYFAQPSHCVLFIASRDVEDNPFQLPADEEIFMLQEDEKQRRMEEIKAQRALPVHMKATFSSQIQATVVRDPDRTGQQHKTLSRKDPIR